MMSENQSNLAYNLQEISGGRSLEELCKKQERLIEMLHKQVNQLKEVIVDMEGEINKFQESMKQLAKEYSIQYNGMVDLQKILPQLKDITNQLSSKNKTNTLPQIQFKQVIKQVPVFIQKQIEIIKQIEKPIFVERIREVEKPVFVQKIIEMPCASCQLASHKRIKT